MKKTTAFNTSNAAATLTGTFSMTEPGKVGTRYFIKEGSDKVTVDDGNCTPFVICIADARRRWLQAEEKGWVGCNVTKSPERILYIGAGAVCIDAEHALAESIRKVDMEYAQKQDHRFDGGSEAEADRAAQASNLRSSILMLTAMYRETGAPFKPYGRDWQTA